MHLANKINEALAGFWNTLLRPVGKLELPYCPGLAILPKHGRRESSKERVPNTDTHRH